jgi:hypothetical protein
MIKLPDNFEMDKYGLHVRLVMEDDAAYIINLRTDAQISRFINKIDNDVEKQREWIQEYKKREKEGLDYYFIYFYSDVPIGLNRLSDIKENEFTGGSFVFNKGVQFELPLYATLIQLDIAFNLLFKEVGYGYTRQVNKKVVKYHKIMGISHMTEDAENVYFEYSRDLFNQRKSIIENMLNSH